jgi:primosomal protein N' (replication factor Y)
MENYSEYAEIAVNRDVNSTIHYHIPDKYEGLLARGHLVRVGFRTAVEPGIVVAIHDELPPDLKGIETKPIIELLDPNPVMTPEHIALGLWMSAAYLTAPGACLWLMLPPGLTGASTKMVHLLDDTAQGTTATQQEILSLLKESSPRTVNDIEKQVSIKTVSRVLRDLEQQGILYIESVLLDSRVSPKTVRTVLRTIPDDELVDALSRVKRAPKQNQTIANIARFVYPHEVPDV